MKNQIDKKVLSTSAKHMICPISSSVKEAKLSELGLVEFSKYKYRMESDSYHGTSIPSERKLLGLLCDSLLKLNNSKKPLLLLSDGKDSMSIALAYNKLGISVETLTLLRENDNELKNYILRTCKSLGHKPRFVTISEILGSFNKDDFLDACTYMSSPVLDQGFLFFLFGIKQFFEESSSTPDEYVLIDGLGNDETFGYIPSKRQLSSLNLSSLGFWKYCPKVFRPIKWFLRSPAESHGDLSALSCFYSLGQSYDINKYFKNIDSTGSDERIIDFRAFCRGSFHDHQCMMGKANTVSKFLDTSVNFPWLNFELADYVFNLPKESKYDFSKLKNKVLLRNLLCAELGWEQTKRGVDLYYDLDLNTFEEKIVHQIVPKNMTNKIKKSIFSSEGVKKRAYLELLNFYGYCLGQGMSEKDIKQVLLS